MRRPSKRRVLLSRLESKLGRIWRRFDSAVLFYGNWNVLLLLLLLVFIPLFVYLLFAAISILSVLFSITKVESLDFFLNILAVFGILVPCFIFLIRDWKQNHAIEEELRFGLHKYVLLDRYLGMDVLPESDERKPGRVTWSDFSERRVFQDQILLGKLLAMISSCPISLLLAKSGAGKTTLSYSLGYSLLTEKNEWEFVFYLNPAIHVGSATNVSEDAIAISRLMKKHGRLKNKRVLLIIDDAHTNSEIVSGLENRLTDYEKHVSILIVSRLRHAESANEIRTWSERICNSNKNSSISAEVLQDEDLRNTMDGMTQIEVESHGLQVCCEIRTLNAALYAKSRGNLLLHSFVLDELYKNSLESTVDDKLVQKVMVCNPLTEYHIQMRQRIIEELASSYPREYIATAFDEITLNTAFFSQMEVPTPELLIQRMIQSINLDGSLATGILRTLQLSGDILLSDHSPHFYYFLPNLSIAKAIYECFLAEHPERNTSEPEGFVNLENTLIRLLSESYFECPLSPLAPMLFWGSENDIHWDRLVKYTAADGMAHVVAALVQMSGSSALGITFFEQIFQQPAAVDSFVALLTPNLQLDLLVEGLISISSKAGFIPLIDPKIESKLAQLNALSSDSWKVLLPLVKSSLVESPSCAQIVKSALSGLDSALPTLDIGTLKQMIRSESLRQSASFRKGISETVRTTDQLLDFIVILCDYDDLLSDCSILKSLETRANDLSVALRKPDEFWKLVDNTKGLGSLLTIKPIANAVVSGFWIAADFWVWLNALPRITRSPKPGLNLENRILNTVFLNYLNPFLTPKSKEIESFSRDLINLVLSNPQLLNHAIIRHAVARIIFLSSEPWSLVDLLKSCDVLLNDTHFIAAVSARLWISDELSIWDEMLTNVYPPTTKSFLPEPFLQLLKGIASESMKKLNKPWRILSSISDKKVIVSERLFQLYLSRSISETDNLIGLLGAIRQADTLLHSKIIEDAIIDRLEDICRSIEEDSNPLGLFHVLSDYKFIMKEENIRKAFDKRRISI